VAAEHHNLAQIIGMVAELLEARENVRWKNCEKEGQKKRREKSR
jgi:hypothetical protein